ncbi:hypothetical protein F511_13079 [Dorcoceras hygrometricum]|uniref:Uncharacterized protein n=1 Tax=Dorcoceras hygrometricum TaxID=472368 RepID=A0A2Z7DDG2_9LAMI|nr:hypothetical protein F511_13079 [Dorcoceras hygrometricum]
MKGKPRSIYNHQEDDLDRPIAHRSTPQIISGTPAVASGVSPSRSWPLDGTLSTVVRWRHTDYGFPLKTQPDLDPAVHMSPYRRSQYNITRIMIPFRITDVTSGPDLNRTYSYTSILRLGLTVGDTPDAPHDHLGTRGPSSSPKVPTCAIKIGGHPRSSYEDLGRWTEDSCLVREYLPRTLSRRKRIPRITKDIRQDILFHLLSPSINTSIGGASPDTLPAPSDQLFVVADIEEESQSSPLSLDVPELLDVLVFARRLR